MGDIDISSIHTCFPKYVKPPERLIQLVEWISGTTYTDLLTPDFRGNYFNFWNGVEIDSDRFGLFLHQADGTTAGYWFYQSCPPERAPIVIIGSGSGQCEFYVIADSLEDFAARVVETQTGIFEMDEPVDLDNSPDDVERFEQWLYQLGNWLEDNWGITAETRQQLIARDPKADHPDFEAWLEDQVERRQQTLASKKVAQVSDPLSQVRRFF